MANLTAEEISHLVMATPPRAFDAQQFQPVVAPPDPQPDPNIPSIQAAAAQPVSADNPSFTVNPNYNTPGQQTFLPEKPAEAQATPPVAIALPRAAQAQQREFTPVSLPDSTPNPLADKIMALPPKTFDGKQFQPVIAPLAAPDKSNDPMADKTEKDQAELARLQNTGSGITQLTKHPGFFHKLGGIAARIGDIAGTALFPSVAAMIPGTELHHQVLMGQQRGIIGEDLGEQKAQQDLDTQTQTDEIAKENATKVPVTNPVTGQTYFVPQKDAAKLMGAGITAQGHVLTGSERVKSTLAQHGLKTDDEGNIVGDPDSPVTKRNAIKDELIQSQTALASAGTKLKEAQAEVEKSKNDPNSPAYKLAIRKLAVAQQNADSMGMRGRAAWANYLMHSQGVGENGAALPGAMLDDNGNTIGSTFSANVRPTGAQRAKANLGQSASEQLKDIKAIVQRRSDIFGPTAGRTTDFSVWVGSQDPDAQRFRAARTIAGDHLAGVFGGRSETALTELDAAIGHFKDNPKAVIAGIDQLDKANESFIKAGTVKTVGSSGSTRPANRQPAARDFSVVDPAGKTHPFATQAQADTFRRLSGIQNNSGGGSVYARDPSGKLHEAPAGSVLPTGWKQETR